jgi:DNA-binding transcriptional LysR family regulator
VGFVSSAITLGVPERIQAFRAAYPDVNLRLFEGQTAVTVQRLLERSIDVGVVRDAEPAPGIEVVTLATERFVAILPAGHRRARARRISADALRDEPFVFYSRTAGELAYRRNLQPCYEAGYEPDVVQEGGHWLTLFYLVGAGTGVTIAPASAADSAPPTVVRVPLSGTEARSEVQLITRTAETRAVVRNFAAG